MMGDDDLWLEGDPFDHPSWQEAERRVRDRECGIHYFGKDWLTCPLWWARSVLAVAQSPQQTVVGLLLYEHTRTDRFVPIPTRLFAEFGIKRQRKYRMLANLEEVGLIKVERGNGRTLRVRLVWPPPTANLST
jgi:hypothetical protein